MKHGTVTNIDETRRNKVPEDALRRARQLHDRGFGLATVAVALRPYCKSMRERNDVLRELFA